MSVLPLHYEERRAQVQKLLSDRGPTLTIYLALCKPAALTATVHGEWSIFIRFGAEVNS